MEYRELMDIHQKRISDFPIRWAFSKAQLQKVLTDWNVEMSAVCTVGAGSVIRKTDVEGWFELLKENAQELMKAMEDSEFLTQAMEYELANHEYCITYDADEALAVLGLTMETLTERQLTCFENARANYLSGCY